MVDAFAKKYGCHEFFDFQAKLVELKSKYTATGFRMGVLAGVIFAGCPKERSTAFSVS